MEVKTLSNGSLPAHYWAHKQYYRVTKTLNKTGTGQGDFVRLLGHFRYLYLMKLRSYKLVQRAYNMIYSVDKEA